MKRKLKFLTILIVGIVGLFLCDTKILALTLLKEPQENVYTYRHGGTSHAFSGPFTYYSVNGKTTYCIEPGVDIIKEANLKETSGFSESPYDEEKNEKIQLIGYYGYDYPGHQTLKYRMATQALIWETVGDQVVEFWTEPSGAGTKYNIETEKENINKLVSEHNKVPSFSNSTKEIIIGESATFTDNNKVLDNFEVIPNKDVETDTSNNVLTVTPKGQGEFTIQLVKKSYTKDPTTIFVGIDEVTQKMAYFGYYNPLTISVKVNVKGIKVQLSKFDQGGTKTPRGDGTLEGAVYGVYKEDNTKIKEVTTGANGIVYFDLPTLGNYYVKEIKASRGYLVDSRKFSFTVQSSNLNPLVRVYESPIQKYIELYKYLSDGKTGEISPEENITFEFYLKSKMTLASTQKTDSKGHLKVLLPYGVYIVKQKDVVPGYEKVPDFEININENSPETITKILTNMKEVKEAYLKVIKIDKSTNKKVSLDDIKFKIKNKQTNQYVCQTSAYPQNKKICEFATKNGVFTTPLPLEYGTYILEEVENQLISGYLWNPESLEFTINEKSNFTNNELGKILEISFANEPVKGRVIIHKVGEIPLFQNNEITYLEEDLDKVQYGLYAANNIYSNDHTLIYHKNDLIGTYETKDGYITIDNLYLGNYYLQELSTKDGYIIDTQKHKFSLKYADQYTKIVTETVELKNEIIKGDLKIQKIDTITNTSLKDAKIAIYNYKDELVYEGTTNEDGEIILNNIPYGNYYLKEIEAPTGYLLNDQKYEFTIVNNKDVINLTLENTPILGSLVFTKIDKETDTPLKDCLIQIFDSNDNIIYEEKTNKDGIINIDNIRYGNYYLKEVEAPTGYVLDKQKYEFSIVNDKDVIDITLENTPIKGFLVFNKKDLETNTPLKDCLIQIFDSNDNLIYEEKTNEDGIININNLKYGNYYLKEVEAPLGYVLNNTIYKFSIVNDKDVINIEMTNQKIKGKLEFTKVDDNNNPLSDVLIAIYNANDELIYEGLTDKQGQIIIDSLEYGNYYLKEKKTLDGYLLNNNKIDFQIQKDGDTVKITMPNKIIYGTVKFTKTDKETGEFLNDAKMAIYDENNELIYEGITTQDGTLTIENLKVGNYYIKEIKAPDGYILDDRKIPFTINENNNLIEINMANEKIPEPPIIFKVPKTNKNINDIFYLIGILTLGIGICLMYGKKN